MPLDTKRAAAIAVEIASLRTLDLDGLRARWHSLRGRPAPKHLPKHLLLRVLAYDLQAAVLGDLDAGTKQYLDRVATDPARLSIRQHQPRMAHVPAPSWSASGQGGSAG